MSQENHPFDRMAQQIEERGVMVYDITQMPVYGEAVISPYVMLALTRSGWMRAELDFETQVYHANDFSLLYPNHVLTPIETSDDFRSSLFVMSHRFYGILAEAFPDNYKYVQYYNNTYHLNEEQAAGILSCFQQLKILSTLDYPYRDKLMTSQVDIMAHLTEIYATENGFVLEEKSGVEQLLLRFHALIADNYNKSREVKFYAEQLCLSPKYFGTVVRQALGYSAGELIARYVMVRAKHLLHYHRKLTIQQVSDRLGFSDQTAFARYFKSHSGQTPQEYREGK